MHPIFADWLANDSAPSDPIPGSVLSRDPAVGEAYAADPLVYHGGWQRPMLSSFKAAMEAIAAGPSFGALPVYYLHGEGDQLAPLAIAQPSVHALKGDDFTEHLVPGAEHEVFNETDRDETIAAVREFVRRVS
jgi:alpha-beta hydrolase superfamily lysophospholipase